MSNRKLSTLALEFESGVLFLLLFVVCCHVSAQSLSYTKEEKRVLLEHEHELKSFVDVVSEDAFMALRIKYHVNMKDVTHLMNLLRDREYRKFAHNYIDVIPRLRVIEKMKIDAAFQDSIDALLIPDNHNISGRNISMALKLSEPLKLSNKKYKFLMDRALSFARMKRQNPMALFAKEEMDAMKKALSRKQIEDVLNEKNRFDANLRAVKIWDELEKAKLTEELDSVSQMFLLKRYYSLLMMYRDYFVGDDETMKKNIDDLYKHRPKSIRMYEALNTRKRVEVEAKEEKKKNVSDTYAW